MIDLDEIKELRDPDISQDYRVWAAAQMYIKAGLYVIPIRPNGKSLPPKDTNVNYGSASRSPQVIDSWFHPTEEGARFRGWNIGIPTGREGGVFVVDADVREDENGIEAFQALAGENEFELDGLCSKTANKGLHYFFHWQEGCMSSTGKIASRVDTRGGTETACKGHVVVWPSVIDGKHYEWVKGGEPMSVPKFIVQAMGMPWRPDTARPRSGGSRGNEEVTPDDVEPHIPLDQVKEMLTYVDPDTLSYDEWLRVGQAINSQHSGEDGLETWDDWSSRGKRYKPKECIVRWHGFDPMGTVRMGTLFHFARIGGWTPMPEDTVPSPWSEVIERLNCQFAMVMVGGKIRILREKSIVDDPMMGTYDLMHRDDFLSLMSNRLHQVNNAAGKPVIRNEGQIWLADRGRRTYENGIGVFPNGAPAGWYNSWAGFTVEPKAGDCHLFLEHIQNIICSGNIDLSEWLLDWMADAVQDPAHPKGCAIVMRGEEGIGKGTLADMFGQLFGPHYRHLIDNSHLLSNFNAHMMDAVMVFADEIIWGGEKKAAGKLKGLVTERYIIGERKGVDAVTMRNMAHLMVASNEEWVIPAGPQSRRWFVLDVPNTHANDRPYFQAIRREMQNGGRSALLHMLLEREISSNLTRAPETRALSHQRMLHHNNNPTVEWWSGCIHDEVIDLTDIAAREFGEPEVESDWPKEVDRAAMYDLYVGWCSRHSMRPAAKSAFYRSMVEFGIKETRAGHRGETRKRRFRVPDVNEARSILRKTTGIVIEE